jgi:hypothetical protein
MATVLYHPEREFCSLSQKKEGKLSIRNREEERDTNMDNFLSTFLCSKTR